MTGMDSDSAIERLYDQYLEIVLQADLEAPPSPEEFLRTQELDQPDLRERLEALYRLRSESSLTSSNRPAPWSRGTNGHASQHLANRDAECADTSNHRERSLGEFRIIRELGQGGMGVVYLAEQPSMGRHVALKVIRPEFARSSSAAVRFDREARAIARLRHPNIVTVYMVGEDRGVRYIAMEYVEGCTLSEVLEQTKKPGRGLNSPFRAATAHAATAVPTTATIVRWTAALARALQYAHDQGIAHRDVKPSNIRLTPDGRPLLLDFGLARELGSTAATLTEHFIGSPQYAAPETIGRTRSAADGRVDVYSLGVVLYEALTGVSPFAGESLEQVLHAILSVDPPLPRRLVPSLPRDLEVIGLKAMEKDPERRYASAGEMAEDLEAMLEFRPLPHARPPGLRWRASKWARRRPALATGLMTSLLAALALIFVVLAQQSRAQHQRLGEARAAIDEAAARTRLYADSRREIESLEREFERLRPSRFTSYLSPEQDRLLDDHEERIARSRQQREEAFHQALALLERAERIGPSAHDSGRAEQIRKELYLARYLDALTVGDEAEQTAYLALLRQMPSASLDSQITRAAMLGGTLRLIIEPPEAEVHLFRLVEHVELVSPEEHGERRLVPVPWEKQSKSRGQRSGGRHDLQPLTTERWPPTAGWALRLEADHDDLRAGDHILTVAGWPVRGSVIVASSIHPDVVRFDRLISIEGVPIEGAYELEQYSGPKVGASRREFVFERTTRDPETERHGHEVNTDSHLVRLSISSLSLDELQIEALDAQALAERGEVWVTVWTGGSLQSRWLAPGAVLRTTAAPVLPGPLSRVPSEAHSLSGRIASKVEEPLEAGGYLALIRADGHEDLRVPIDIERGRTLSLRLRLLPVGTTPPGFRCVPYPAAESAMASRNSQESTISDVMYFWIMEREVTMSEYLAFLNDPATLATLDEWEANGHRLFAGGQGEIRQAAADRRSGLVPRLGGGIPPLERDETGQFHLPQDWRADWPAFGVSWDDAQAYAAWRTAKAQEAGQPFVFALPTLTEWVGAGGVFGGGSNRLWAGGRGAFVFGHRFRPKWVSSCHARPKPWPEPGLRFPIDESILGVFDMSGSMSEWLDEWWLEHSGLRKHAGGSWADGGPEHLFGIFGGNGARPYATSGHIGFRLVARPIASEPNAP